LFFCFVGKCFDVLLFLVFLFFSFFFFFFTGWKLGGHQPHDALRATDAMLAGYRGA